MSGKSKNVLSVIMIFALLMSLYIPVYARIGILGDVNMDYEINPEDARQALRLAVGLDVMNDDTKKLSDTDGDGKVTPADARTILRVSVGLDTLNGKTVEIGVAQVGNPGENTTAPGTPVENPETPVGDLPSPEVEAKSGTFTFVMYGNGHGVGLTQYGAKVLAENGWLYWQILDYYYVGTLPAKDAEIPETTYYSGKEYDTEELVDRIVYMEIAGITDNPEALKAQAVAVYTLLKRNNFHIEDRSSVGIAAASLAHASENLYASVREVLGEYRYLSGDPTFAPVSTVYSAMCAGRTLTAAEAWGGGNFPHTGVYSLFESSQPNFITYYTCSAETMKNMIMGYDSSIVLSEDPADWLEIVSHNASISPEIGYVTEIRVGDRTYRGIRAFNSRILNLKTGCFTIVYTR